MVVRRERKEDGVREISGLDEDDGDEGDRVLVFWEPKEKRESRDEINEIGVGCILVSCAAHMGGVVLGFLLFYFFQLNKQAFGIGSGKFGPVLHFQYFQHFSCIFS